MKGIASGNNQVHRFYFLLIRDVRHIGPALNTSNSNLVEDLVELCCQQGKIVESHIEAISSRIESDSYPDSFRRACNDSSVESE